MTKSASFVADLPSAMTPEHLEKLYNWGKSTCLKFDIHMGGDETITLVATRKKEGTARDHMRLLHTCLKNWGVDVPKRSGWLRLVGHEPEEDRQTEPPEDQNVATTPTAQQSETFVRSEFPARPLADEAHTPAEPYAGAERGVDGHATSRAEGNDRSIAAPLAPAVLGIAPLRLRPPMNLLTSHSITVH